jgi:hypothetical protein
MKRSETIRGARTAVILGFMLLLAAGMTAAQGIWVALTPNMVQVAPGALFDLDMTITQAGSAFNGFNAVIGFDPAAVTCVPRDPLSEQEGALMRGACPVRFHRFEVGAETDTIGDFLLCNETSITGPGQIYHLQFRASDTPQVTMISFLQGLHFYEDGVYVTPLHASDAVIGIGLPPASADPRGQTGDLQLRIAPNPVRGEATFTVWFDRGGAQSVSLIDIDGRLVRRFVDAPASGGMRIISWDGNDSAGRPLPSGVYFVTFEAAGRSIADRVSFIR